MSNPQVNGKLDIVRQLGDEPFNFDFFQAVRILDWSNREENSNRTAQPIGRDAVPKNEAVRIKAHQSLSFPSGLVAEFDLSQDDKPPEMTVPFFGLTGPTLKR